MDFSLNWWTFRGFFMELVDFSWIVRGIGGFFIDFSLIFLMFHGFFVDLVDFSWIFRGIC